MAWFHRKAVKLKESQKKSIPDDLWIKCPSCSEIIYKPELKKNHSVCRHCKHHFINSRFILCSTLIEETEIEK